MRYKPTNFTQLLQVALIVLKLCGIIQWRWIWVLAPLWVYMIVYMAMSKWGI